MGRLIFNSKGRSWILACVFSVNLYVFVNECPTEEINIQKGLKQGDPLAPFIFILMVRGLSTSIRRVKELGEYTGFQVGSSALYVSHLQYVDDTFFIADALMTIMWILKTIMWFLGLASGHMDIMSF